MAWCVWLCVLVRAPDSYLCICFCRVIYAIRTPNDHGAVNNDASWEADDASVMEAETPEELRAESETAADEDAEGSKKQDTQK